MPLAGRVSQQLIRSASIYASNTSSSPPARHLERAVAIARDWNVTGESLGDWTGEVAGSLAFAIVAARRGDRFRCRRHRRCLSGFGETPDRRTYARMRRPPRPPPPYITPGGWRNGTPTEGRWGLTPRTSNEKNPGRGSYPPRAARNGTAVKGRWGATPCSPASQRDFPPIPANISMVNLSS